MSDAHPDPDAKVFAHTDRLLAIGANPSGKYAAIRAHTFVGWPEY